jgi:hypothetical protein
MQIDTTLFAAIAGVLSGGVVLWANPRRNVNRVFFSLSLHVGLWLLSLRQVYSGEDGLYWIRITTAVGALVPAHLWLVKEVIVLRELRVRDLWHRGWPVLAAALVLTLICFSEWYIPSSSTKNAPVFGVGYYFSVAALGILYIVLIRQAVVQVGRQAGVAKLELQIMLLGGCIAAGGIIVLMAIRSIWPDLINAKLRLQPIVVLAF